MTIVTSGTFGVFRFLVDRCDLAYQRLKDAGFAVSLLEVLALEMADKPGGLHAVADTLACHGVNVENSSGFVTEPHQRAVLILEVREVAHARQVLEQQGFHLFTEEELLSL